MLKLVRRTQKRADEIESLVAEAPRQRLALLLAGGDGTRLREFTSQLTGSPIPKQYCPLLHGRSLLEVTLSRTRYFAPIERTRIIVNQNHLGLARAQLGGLWEGSLVVQPENRDTGPGMIFALLCIEETHPDAIVAVFPTDHYVDDGRVFIAHALKATCMVNEFHDKVAILGVTPDHPASEYGYILPGQPLVTAASPSRAFQVLEFKEKPEPAEARAIIARGGLWNTFVMAFQLKRMLDLLRDLAPADSRKLFELKGSFEKASQLYRDLPPWNFSNQILAQIPEELIVLKAPDIHWSDWGTRESIERTYKQLRRRPSWRRSTDLAGTGTA